MSTASLTIADGSGAATSITNGATVRVTPGNALTFTLTNGSTGIRRWILRVNGNKIGRQPDGTLGMGYQAIVGPGESFSIVAQLPNQDDRIEIRSETGDAFNNKDIVSVTLDCRSVGKTSAFAHKVRGVIPAALAAYTNVAGVLTANANGALATQDGLTVAVGERYLFPVGAAVADDGIYVCTSIGGASSKFVFTRAPDWAQGDVIQSGDTIEVSEGTLFAQSTWKATATGAITVGTTSPLFMPRCVIQSLALVAGTTTITNVPTLSATKTLFTCNRTTANTTASTITYQSGAVTPGKIGTASVVYMATVAAGTINVADISTLSIAIINW